MTRIWKNPALLGLATLATLGLAAAQPVAAQSLSGFSGFAPPNGTQTNTSVTPNVTVPYTVATVSADNSSLQLTNGVDHVASSLWSNTPVNIGEWNASFDYQESPAATSTTNVADGFSFAMQTEGTTALGGLGGSIGYSSAGNNGPGIITGTSAAVQFNIYKANTTGFTTNNATAIDNLNGKSQYALPTNFLSSGDLINVSLSYSNTNNWLTETLTDLTNPTTFTQSYYTNLGGLFSANSGQAYVGFTGGSGGTTATQTITNFTFNGSPSAVGPLASPVAVTGFNAAGIQDTPGQAVTPLDVPNQYAFYTVNDNSTGGGLPENGVIVSTGSSQGGTFQIGTPAAPYAGNNVLVLSNNPSIPTKDTTNPASYSFGTTGTLTLATPRNYDTIGILAAAAYGPATMTATFHYSDGSAVVMPFSVLDWYNTATTPVNAPMRIGVGTSTAGPNSSATGPHMYENYFQVDPTKTLESIDFDDTKAGVAGTTVAEIFAVNGVAAAPEPGELAALTLGAFGLLGLIAKKRRTSAA